MFNRHEAWGGFDDPLREWILGICKYRTIAVLYIAHGGVHNGGI